MLLHGIHNIYPGCGGGGGGEFLLFLEADGTPDHSLLQQEPRSL
jgi:hypothetical protein